MNDFFIKLGFGLPDNCFFSPHYNYVFAPIVMHVSVYRFVYAGMALLAIIIFLIRRKNFSFSLLTACWIVWAAVVAMQVLHQNWYTSVLFSRIGGMDNDRKNEIFFGHTYKAARLFSSSVPKGSSAQLVTDWKVRQNIDTDVLPYFMFPQLDIIHPVDRPQYLVLFHKANITDAETAGFRKVAEIDSDASLWERTDGR